MKTTLTFVLCALALLLAPGALGSHSFTDVPDGAPFHEEIGIFKATNITTGCTATTFCPQEFVRRQAMAAFIDRALGLVIRPGETTSKGIPGSRVAMLDDDVSFVGTASDGLTLANASYPVLRLEGGLPGSNLIAGAGEVTAGAIVATVAGGGTVEIPNRVTDNFGTVGGGDNNTAGNANGLNNDAVFATVAGGVDNTAGSSAAVGGGFLNRATGEYSTVPGGINNTAAAAYSFAAGHRARANHQGTFVWADSTNADFSSGAANEFSVRASGGFHFWTDGGITTGCGMFAGGGSWVCSSDRRLKEHFRPVNGERLLERLAGVPITSWNFKTQRDSIRHIGPMAQDFSRAFGVGESPRHIGGVDADGVALAAIQALYRQNRAKDAQLRRQQRQIDDLRRSVAELARERK